MVVIVSTIIRGLYMGQSMGEDIRYISLFSGVEACSVAWYHMKNWKAQAFAEFDAFPSAVLKYHFPHIPNVGDVTKHDWKQYKGKCELVVGGSPCQSFSVAGQRLGMDDPRGNLALHFLRVVNDIRPTWFLFENVAGLLSSDNGRDFATFLREVERIGYGCAYRIFDAQYFGVPQRRRRLFVVGHIDRDWRSPAAVLFEPEGLSRNPPTSKKTRQGTTGDATNGIRNGSGRRINDTLDTKPAGALTTEIYHRGGYGDQTVNTHAALVPEVADTVAAKWYKGADVQLGAQSGGNIIPVQVYENHGQDSRIKPVDVSPSIPAKAGTGGNNLPIVSHAIPIHDQATRWSGKRGDNQDGKGNGLGVGRPGDPSNTLTGNARHAVMDESLVVRRLTPIECERLQGFPDNWTQIPWNNKPKEKCPDSHRFKAMGNSMAVPVMRWIGEGIELVNRIPKTEAPQQEELGWL